MGRYLIVGLLVLLAAGTFAGCRKNTPESYTMQEIPAPIDEERPLVALAETREEAQSIAELYGIELADWGYGVATYRTDEDPREVIRRGQENAWPELSLNYIQQAFGK